jgi:hypothetical protein
MARLLSANGGAGAASFQNEVGSSGQMFNESGVDYNYNYEY